MLQKLFENDKKESDNLQTCAYQIECSKIITTINRLLFVERIYFTLSIFKTPFEIEYLNTFNKLTFNLFFKYTKNKYQNHEINWEIQQHSLTQQITSESFFQNTKASIPFLSCFSFFPKDWSDYFTGSQTKTTGKTTHLTVSSNLWIYGCTFKNIEKYRGKGSCICKDSSTSFNLLVDSSSFNTCSSTGHGGAIYFATSGQCVLSSVCGVNCKTGTMDYFGQFCRIYVSVGSQYKNYLIHSSVTLIEQKYVGDTTHHQNGYVLYKGVNVSNNEVDSTSGIKVLNPSISSISFSSFRNNNVTGDSSSYICLDFVSSSHQMTNTNIIENTQESTFLGIITTEGSAILTMKHCSVFGNCETGSGSIFCTFSGTSITCTDCSMTQDQKNSHYGSFSTINRASESFINYYKYLELDECKAGLDIWSDIYPIIPTPKPTNPPKETPEQTPFNEPFNFIYTMKKIIAFF